MSHFTVLVIGDNPEDQLAPFDENIQMDQYVKYTKEELIVKGRKEIEDYKNSTYADFLADPEAYKASCKNKDHINYVENEFPKKLSWTDEQVYEEEIKWYEEDELGENGEAFSTYNPKSKWDWYQLGGRWTGFFKLKENTNEGNLFTDEVVSSLAVKYNTSEETVRKIGEVLLKDGDTFNKVPVVVGGYHLEREIEQLIKPQYENAQVGSSGLMTGVAKSGWVDQALIKDIDFQGMRDADAKEATKRYERLERLLGGSIPKIEVSWEEILADKEGKYGTNIDMKRSFYHGQEALKKVKEAQNQEGLSDQDRSTLVWLQLSDYQVSKEEYAAKAAARAIAPFAVVKDGKWYEKGEMGWWACVSNEKEQSDWNEQVMELLIDLPEDTMVSLYDCHI